MPVSERKEYALNRIKRLSSEIERLETHAIGEDGFIHPFAKKILASKRASLKRWEKILEETNGRE